MSRRVKKKQTLDHIDVVAGLKRPLYLRIPKELRDVLEALRKQKGFTTMNKLVTHALVQWVKDGNK